MENRNHQKKDSIPIYILFFIGIFIGIIMPNVMWKMEWKQRITSFVYLISMFVGKSSGNITYLMDILSIRGLFLMTYVLCGVTVFGVPIAIFGIVSLGMEVGLILTLSILQFGFQGGFIGVGLLFPQYLVYIPCMFYLLKRVYIQSLAIWHLRGLYPVKVKRYFFSCLACVFVFFIGVLGEFLINPIITEVLTKSLKIF